MNFCQAIQVADFRMMRERFQPVGCRCVDHACSATCKQPAVSRKWAGSQHERHQAARHSNCAASGGLHFRQTIEGFERHVIRALIVPKSRRRLYTSVRIDIQADVRDPLVLFNFRLVGMFVIRL